MKIRKPEIIANIYSSGKIVCLGCPSEYEGKIASRRIGRIIQRLILNDTRRRIRISNYKVHNVNGHCAMPYVINIEKFADKYRSEIR